VRFHRELPAKVRPIVKIKLGTPSDAWPHEQKTPGPYVAELLPTLEPYGAFIARVIAAERTFWEKACVLHEKSFRPANKPRKLRMALHYCDLRCLLRAGVCARALVNDYTTLKAEKQTDPIEERARSKEELIELFKEAKTKITHIIVERILAEFDHLVK
jgi:hypothetical protein